ncbi:MAG TPA: hypothetical protein VI504_17040 [Candidatus Eisenbacteria bacterium]|jgi:hypothetical protein
MLNISFLGDDYVFLDKTRAARFADLWSFRNTDFGWYRPWSREVHFWFMQRLVGTHEVGFRLASVLLWLCALGAYGAYIRTFASRRTAWIATLGSAALALWVAPLLWISGSQDLWMAALGMLALWLFARGRTVWALLPYALALLSKETAAVLPVIAFGYAWLVMENPPVKAFQRVLPWLLLTVVWLCVHPALIHRLTAPGSTAGEPHPAAPTLVLHTLLSVVNANWLGQPLDAVAFNPLRTGAATLLLLAGVLLALPAPAAGPSADSTNAEMARCVRFGAWWSVAGWLPLLHPSIGWHPYYGCIGALGAWLVLGGWLARRASLVVPAILALGLLHGVSGAARSWDWGSEWYQRRAGNLLGVIRDQLRQQHPTLPAHSRLFFGSIPNNIGLVAGQSPAVRVWYGDTTLEAGFYSYYAPRSSGRPAGPDLFFLFDSTSGLREVHLGPEDVTRAVREQPDWQTNHESLAMLLLSHGDPLGAAGEFEKLASLPRRSDALMYAAVCREIAGERARADSLYALFGQRTGGTRAQIEEYSARLRASVPGR